jgi:ParB family chromosome partitioning protein
MGKMEDLLKTQGNRIGASLGMGVERRVLPPGMNAADARPVPAREQGVSRSKNAVEVAVGRIRPDPGQPREDFDTEALDRLAESLKTRGQIQPIRVRWDESQETYVIVTGERRWRAAISAGLPTLTCIVHDTAVEPNDLLALQLVENALREDLTPIEQARAYKKLMDLNGWSGTQLARELFIAQPAVVYALGLLKLPDAVQARVDSRELAARAAYEISKLPDADAQAELAEEIVAGGLSVSQTADVVKARKAGRPAPATAAARREVKLPDGSKVIVTGPCAIGAEAQLAALKAAAKVIQAEVRAAAKDQSTGRGEAA